MQMVHIRGFIFIPVRLHIMYYSSSGLRYGIACSYDTLNVYEAFTWKRCIDLHYHHFHLFYRVDQLHKHRHDNRQVSQLHHHPIVDSKVVDHQFNQDWIQLYNHHVLPACQQQSRLRLLVHSHRINQARQATSQSSRHPSSQPTMQVSSIIESSFEDNHCKSK